MVPGLIAHFTDGQKGHTGVVLDVSDDGEAWALFLTSNPTWNRRSRRLTLDELSLCGFPLKEGMTTYFAPVVRPARDAHHSGLMFPEHRLTDLASEFGPSPFLPPAVSLPSEMFPPVKTRRSSFSKEPLARHFDRGTHRIGATTWSKEELDRLSRVCWGLVDMPRSELIQLCSLLPEVRDFFTRRSSITFSLQARWGTIGAHLAEHRERRAVPLQLMARRMGVTDQEFRGFENGLLCPSFDEMLTIQALLPGIPDEWTLPTSVPLLADVLILQMRRRNWKMNQISSQMRIPMPRVDEIIVATKRPSDPEMEKLSRLFPGLPPWRPCYKELDQLHPILESDPTKSAVGSRP